VNDEREPRAREPRPATAVLLSLAFAAAVAMAFRAAWHPPPGFYVYNVPIAVPFAGFFLDRWSHRGRRGLAVDAAVLALALLRVAAPPLPYASGHTLFAAYAAATAHGWVLRATATIVLAHVIYLKLLVTGGLGSMVAGLVIAAAAARLRRHLNARGAASTPAGAAPAP
jgi:hypothetical protein